MDEKSKPVGLLLTVIFTVVVLIACLIGSISDSQYNSKMSSLNRTAEPVAGANKIVLYTEEDNYYTDRYIPDSLLEQEEKKLQ